MNAKILLVIASSITLFPAFAQEPIDVTDQTIKIGATRSEEIMLGFAGGDKIVFNFTEVNGKDLKEVEVIEYPSTSKFSDFKTNKIENKILAVSRQSVYIFRFKNAAFGGRVCKIHVQRIPANNETKNFNTAVSWIPKQDTTWNTYTKNIVIGYDTTFAQKTKKELIKTEQREELLLDKPQRIHSTTNENGNRTSVFFTLPPNSITHNKITKVIAWAYWIGVGEEANKAWQSNVKVMQSAIKTGAAYFTTPLGALAIGAVANLLTPKLGEDVYYAVTDQQNRNLFQAGQQFRLYDNGKGQAGYRKFTNPGLCQGTYFICMSNDNSFQGIDATVKVIAIVETSEYEDKAFTEMIVNPRFEKKLFKEPTIKSYNAPVTGL